MDITPCSAYRNLTDTATGCPGGCAQFSHAGFGAAATLHFTGLGRAMVHALSDAQVEPKRGERVMEKERWKKKG